MTPTCETCAHGDKSSDDEPCNRCAVTDGHGSRLPVRWVAKAPEAQRPAPVYCAAPDCDCEPGTCRLPHPVPHHPV